MSSKADMCLLITSCNGPGECHQTVAGILRRMQEDAETMGLDPDVSTTPTKHGLKSAVEVLPHEVTFKSFRAGGPGGQHQNTTDSAVRAMHQPTGLTAVARETRSQHRNKGLAMERLQALMNAQAMADQDAIKCEQNRLHNLLVRGNAVRCFNGCAFREEGGNR